jgi:ABC-type glutathione transport system ATPase component
MCIEVLDFAVITNNVTEKHTKYIPLYCPPLKELSLHLLIVNLLHRESPSLIIRDLAQINLPTNLETSVTHRYSANSFKLHRLPTPRPGQVLGLVGTNGIGKSTALKILSGKLKPNLGRYESPPDWEEILKYFRGSELQSESYTL